MSFLYVIIRVQNQNNLIYSKHEYIIKKYECDKLETTIIAWSENVTKIFPDYCIKTFVKIYNFFFQIHYNNFSNEIGDNAMNY